MESWKKSTFGYLTHVRIRDFDDFSNLADFSCQNGESYRQTVFFIVFYVFDLVFACKILNHIIIRFSKKSILGISPMSESEILTIFQTWPIFPAKMVRDILKRISLSYSTSTNLDTLLIC